ncbi:MAG: polysaccharide biosynthesis protein [Candidatus Peribacteraceae bacterium]|nr:polysaccharide biosynthesis protein [Candidatus Peribacteraceae bacterium]MDD5741917.1 polysaccharide biosynthesis protein [Candidatus Peribacteraceae bacterium]
MSFFKDKTILVTGGTGSIGSEVVRQLLVLRPKAIRVFSRDEHKQYLFGQELGPDAQPVVRYLLGDIRDYPRLVRALEGVDFVFHCAAYKHVPFCEYNSFEAVKTNVIGTQNLVDAAITQGVSRVLLISTDKAASPSNVMGATKLLAEKMMTSAMNFAGDRPIRFASVRFGNVLASRGSVLPLFCRQIEHGGPVTVTNPDMIRFFMSIPQAVSLLFRAMVRMDGGELFILKMPVLRLGDMIDILIEELAPRFGHAPAVIKRQIIGARPGEKTEEILMTTEESQYAIEENDMFVVRPPILLADGKWSESKKGEAVQNGQAAHVPPLSREQIRTLLAPVLTEYFKNR